MSALEQLPQNMGLQKISGRIKNYKCQREQANFFFTEGDQSTMGLVAVAAAAVGASGAAMGTTMAASDLEETADYVEFMLGNKSMKGWLWRSPFKDDDVVDVVGEWRDTHFEVMGVARVKDRSVALYPHCTRGTERHIKNAVTWWLIGTTSLFALIWLFFGLHFFVTSKEPATNFDGLQPAFFLWVALPFYILSGLFTVHMSCRLMKFVRVAEQVFKAFGWPEPSKIDLPKRTKAQRKPGESGECGVFYFRY